MKSFNLAGSYMRNVCDSIVYFFYTYVLKLICFLVGRRTHAIAAVTFNIVKILIVIALWGKDVSDVLNGLTAASRSLPCSWLRLIGYPTP